MSNNISVDDVCPVYETLELFNRKWAMCIVTDMFFGRKHFSEFKESNPELSNYILSNTLKFLEEKELVLKNVYDTGSTEYILTMKGRKLSKVLFEMALYSLDELDCSKYNDSFKKELHDKYYEALIKNQK